MSRRRTTTHRSLVLLRGNGRPAWSIEVGWPTLGLLQTLAPALFALGIWAGWALHGQLGVHGPWTQKGVAHEARGRWAHFTSAGKPVPSERLRQMKRRAAIAYAARMGLGSTRAARKLLGGLVPQPWIDAANRGREGDGGLRWPVPEGWYVRGFGSGTGGYHLAVDIMGERGTDVLAVAPGIVAYAGSGVRGFGNLIALIHPGGRVSVYAHNARHYVVPGERVRQGQPVAALGNTGISRGPHVHFELIHEGKNCDPLPLFRPGVRHRAGHLSPIDRVDWRPREDRPPGIRCARRRRHPNSRWHDEHSTHAKSPASADPHSDGDRRLAAGAGSLRDGESAEHAELRPPPAADGISLAGR